MVRPPGQGRQLPGRGVRGADRRPAPRAGRHAALSATALDRRPEALQPGRDPGVGAPVALEGGAGAGDGVVQVRVTPKTKNPFTIKALSISGVTWNWHVLNHAL